MYACLTSQVPFNAILNFIFYKERPTFKGMIGIVIIITGVIWLCIAKNDVAKDLQLSISESE